MISFYKITEIRSIFTVLVIILFIFPATTIAEDTLMLETVEAKKIEMVSGKSIILRSAAPIKRVSVAEPKIADFLLISPNEIYLTGNPTLSI